MLQEALTSHPNINVIGDIISTGAFLGNKFHRSLIAQIGEYAKRLSPVSLKIPTSGPKALFRADNIIPKGRSTKTKHSSKDFEFELNNIVKSAEETSTHEPKLMDKWKAQALDCYLYAQDDQYISKKN